MKKLMSLAVLAFFVAFALAGPNFGGSWVFNKGKSDIPQGPGGGRFGGGTPRSLEIVHNGEGIQITRTLEGQDGQTRQVVMNYSSDGKEVENTMGQGGSFKVKSKWDGAALVSSYSISRETPQGSFTIETIEKLSLSEDGKSLTIETTRKSQRGEFVTKHVFDKK